MSDFSEQQPEVKEPEGVNQMEAEANELEAKAPEGVSENQDQEQEQAKSPEDVAQKPPSGADLQELYKDNPNVRVTNSGTILWEPLCNCPSRGFNCVEDPNLRNPEKNTKKLFKPEESPCTK